VCVIGFDVGFAVCRGGRVFSWGRVTDSSGPNELPRMMANVLCSPDEPGHLTASRRVKTEDHIHVARAERVACLLVTNPKTALCYIVDTLNGNGPVRFKVDALMKLDEIRYINMIEYMNVDISARVVSMIKPLVALLISGDDAIAILVCKVLYTLTLNFRNVGEIRRTITDTVVSEGVIGPFVRIIRGGNDKVRSLVLTVLLNIAMNIGTHDYIIIARYGAVDHLLALVCGRGNMQVRNVAAEVLNVLAKNQENNHMFVRYRAIERLDAVLLGDLSEISYLYMLICTIIDLIS